MLEDIPRNKMQSGISLERGQHMSGIRNKLKAFHGKLNSDYTLLFDCDVVFFPDTLGKLINVLRGETVMVSPFCISGDFYSYEKVLHYYDTLALTTLEGLSYRETGNTCIFKHCSRCIKYRKDNNITIDQTQLLDSDKPIHVNSCFGSFSLIKTDVYNQVFWGNTVCEHISFCEQVRNYGKILIEPSIKISVTTPEFRNYEIIESDLKDIISSKTSGSILTTVFETIAANGGWESDSSISGSGSTIEANVYRVNFLDKFIKQYKITHLVDIPCGDCTWQHTIPDLDKIKYFGADISATALRIAREKNKDRPYMVFSDTPIDLTENPPYIEDGPKETTLIMIKEVVQHLTLDQGMSMLRNAKRSGIQYIAVTNHDKDLFDVKENVEIVPGDFYPNNIFMHPFNFKNPIMDIADDMSLELTRGYGNLIIFNLQEQVI
jgi:hypothetical protein